MNMNRKHIDQLGDLPYDMLAMIEGKYPGKPDEAMFIELVERARGAALDEIEERLDEPPTHPYASPTGVTKDWVRNIIREIRDD